MPEVSVIIPVYNVEKYLPQCLDSVINQTFTDIEIICVNDGSTDESAEILQKYAAKDSRIKVITQENKGLSATRNIGLAHATADYISFIDSDDFISSVFLENLYQAICTTNSDIAGCNFAKIENKENLPILYNPEVRKFAPAIDVLLDKKNFIHFNVWNKLYKREAIKDIRFIEGIYYEDWVFNTCVFAQIESFAWIDSPFYGYRISNESIMRSSYNLKKLNDYVIGINEVYKFINKNYSLQWLKIKQTRIARTVKMMMNSALRSKNSEIINETKRTLKDLYKKQIVGYRGLSLQNKIKLFKFLHGDR